MKKRSKIIVSLVLSICCLSLLVYGIYAATKVSFSLVIEMGFNPGPGPGGIYVDAQCEVLGGKDADSLVNLSAMLNEPSYNTSFQNYSSLTDGTFSDKRMGTWKPAPLTASEETGRLIEYRVTFTNQSKNNICIFPENQTTINSSNLKMVEMTDTLLIKPNTKKQFRLRFRVIDLAVPISQENVRVDFTMQREADVQELYGKEEYFQTSADGTTIMGLTQTYLDEAPEILYVPAGINGTAISGPSTDLDAETPEGVFAKSTSKYVIFQEGITKMGMGVFTLDEGFLEDASNNAVAMTEAEIKNQREGNVVSAVYIPETVTSIEYVSFLGCTNLTYIHLPENVETIGIADVENEPSYMGAFAGCYSLVEIEIPSKVTIIGEYTFSDCLSLEKVTFMGNVTVIQGVAFSNCKSLGNFEIPASCTNIQALAFSHSKINNLIIKGNPVLGGPEGIYYTPFYKATIKNIEHSTSGTGYTFVNGTLTITANIDDDNIAEEIDALSGFVKHIVIKSDVSEIGNLLAYHVFDGGRFRADFIVEDGNTAWYSIDGSLITKNADGSLGLSIANGFATCITIPDNTSIISPNAFYKNDNLEIVKIGAGVENVWSGAFNDCTNLKTIIVDSSTVASGLTALDSQGGCLTYATTIYIKEGLTAGSYVANTSNYTVATSDKTGYVKYVKVA